MRGNPFKGLSPSRHKGEAKIRFWNKGFMSHSGPKKARLRNADYNNLPPSQVSNFQPVLCLWIQTGSVFSNLVDLDPHYEYEPDWDNQK